MDTWISCILRYTDTWIHGYPFSLDTWILGYFGYQFFSLSRFWISYPSIRIFLDNFLNYHKLKKGNQIQVLILCSIYVYYLSIKNRGCSSLISYMEMQFSAIWAAQGSIGKIHVLFCCCSLLKIQIR